MGAECEPAGRYDRHSGSNSLLHVFLDSGGKKKKVIRDMRTDPYDQYFARWLLHLGKGTSKNDCQLGADIVKITAEYVVNTCELISTCLKNSHLWSSLKQFSVIRDMRTDPYDQYFARWLLHLGKGTSKNDCQLGADIVKITAEYVVNTCELISTCLKNSHLWSSLKQFSVIRDMRTDPYEQYFARWLLHLGKGTSKNDCQLGADIVKITAEYVVK
ncbi:ATP-dependent DNA helicase [Trichonephila clavipes]|nr:ATP-dependent DNA helicase [Trichonephila clavipes]